MKIAFYGSSLLSSYWNGAATYYRGLLRDLARRGYDITFYEPDAFDRQKHRDIDPPEWAKVVVYPATVEAARGKLFQDAAVIGSRAVPVRREQARSVEGDLHAGVSKGAPWRTPTPSLSRMPRSSSTRCAQE